MAATEGDRFGAWETGRELHLDHGISDMEVILVLSAAVLGSELRRLLLSPSAATFTFLLKLKTRKKPFGDDLPLEKLWEWSITFPPAVLPNPKGLGGT